jgi:glycosyltransferase involved in cell wall biosynthesis
VPFEYEVVIPAWNAEAFLSETLQSLTAQTLPPRRVTVVDDGSSDGTIAIAEAHGVRVLKSSHVGVVGVRNQGLAQVEAPFVAFVDSDDLWLPRFAERQAETWQSVANDVSAIGSLVEPFGDGDLTAWQGPSPTGGLRMLTPEQVWERNPLTASALMFRTRALRRIGGWREGYTPTDDYDTTLRLVSDGGQLGLLQEVLAQYRVRSGSWSSRPGPFLESEQKALSDFWASSFRRENLPDLPYTPRARALWWRALARAAQYGQDLRGVPAPAPGLNPTPFMKGVHTALRVPGLAPTVAAAWRGFRRSLPRT